MDTATTHTLAEAHLLGAMQALFIAFRCGLNRPLLPGGAA